MIAHPLPSTLANSVALPGSNPIPMNRPGEPPRSPASKRRASAGRRASLEAILGFALVVLLGIRGAVGRHRSPSSSNGQGIRERTSRQMLRNHFLHGSACCGRTALFYSNAIADARVIATECAEVPIVGTEMWTQDWLHGRPPVAATGTRNKSSARTCFTRYRSGIIVVTT